MSPRSKKEYTEAIHKRYKEASRSEQKGSAIDTIQSEQKGSAIDTIQGIEIGLFFRINKPQELRGHCKGSE